MSSQSGLSLFTDGDDGEGRIALSDLEEEMTDSEEDDDDVDSSFDDDSSAISPTSRAEHDARHRSRDEKRLMIDLRKHQQLLIDSEKMSQSIKRCLNWTDELISEGKKALEYHVKVSDVELGGRVLMREDEDEDDRAEMRRGLLSPTLKVANGTENQFWANGVADKNISSPASSSFDEFTDS